MEDDNLLLDDRGRGYQYCFGMGTHEQHSCWINLADRTGLICSGLVVVFLAYSTVVVALGLWNGAIHEVNGILLLCLCGLSIWCHLKTMYSDPGAVPRNAHPLPNDVNSSTLSICGRCDAYKPPGSHHDRVSNRCVSRMDHFCPWMNNAIGAKNQKDFLLFLIYTDMAAVYMYILFALHLVAYDFIGAYQLTGSYLILVRILMFVLLFGIIFTSSMIANQIYGLAIGQGTIDRMKMKNIEMGSPVTFTDVFGSRWIAYFLPLEPYFEDHARVFKYSIKSEPLASFA